MTIPFFSVSFSDVSIGALRPRSALSAVASVVVFAAWGASSFDAVAGASDSSTPVGVSKPSAAASLSKTADQTACDSATGAVREVGPGKTYARPSAAAAVARAGDVVRIAAGDYRGDVATWSARNLTICGVGGRARLYADGRSAGRKAIWVISGPDITIDSVEFHDTVVPDRNGAGIRMEHTTGNLRIINSGFYDNQNGILTTGGPVSLTIERSEFARNSNGGTDGQTHNLYVGGIDKLTVSASYFHGARYGSNLKSRAKESVVENSYLMDGPSGPGSYLADFSNGGKVVLRGNMFHKGPKAPNGVAIQYGAEGRRWNDNSLEMSHNTVVTTRPRTTFLRVQPWAKSVELTANIFASTTGSDALISNSEFPLIDITQRFNAVMKASLLPGADNIKNPNFWPSAPGLQQTAILTRTDRAYANDAQAPYALRPINRTTPARVGALQTAP